MIQWYAIRAAGVMTLILFSLTVVLGLLHQSRLASRSWPRFLVDRVHASVGLLAVVFLAVHIVVAVLDRYVSVPLVSAVVPFTAGYRPLWTGLGAVACDLLIAVVVTSLLRARLGHRAWRAVHWFTYAAWPLAVAHGIGNGTDAFAVWMLVIDAVCVAAVLAALAVRVHTGPRVAAEARPAVLA